MVLDVFDDESENSTLRNKNFNTKLGEIRYLAVPDIIDYKWVQHSEIQNNGSNRLDKIHQYT